MNREDVAKVLGEFKCFRWTSELPGFLLHGHPTCRLKHGGGIAGRSNVWWIERIDGADLSWQAKTRAQLRRLIREWLAEQSEGPRPRDRVDHNGNLLRAYAKQHTFLGNTNWVWIYRKARTPGKDGTT